MIEEALNGRTTVFEVPFEPGRNGLAHLPVALETPHARSTSWSIALGTNDLFLPGALTAHHAARGAITLAEVVRDERRRSRRRAARGAASWCSPPFAPLGVVGRTTPPARES